MSNFLEIFLEMCSLRFDFLISGSGGAPFGYYSWIGVGF